MDPTMSAGVAAHDVVTGGTFLHTLDACPVAACTARSLETGTTDGSLTLRTFVPGIPTAAQNAGLGFAETLGPGRVDNFLSLFEVGYFLLVTFNLGSKRDIVWNRHGLSKVLVDDGNVFLVGHIRRGNSSDGVGMHAEDELLSAIAIRFDLVVPQFGQGILEVSWTNDEAEAKELQSFCRKRWRKQVHRFRASANPVSRFLSQPFGPLFT